jgi:hypothetical protein
MSGFQVSANAQSASSPPAPNSPDGLRGQWASVKEGEFLYGPLGPVRHEASTEADPYGRDPHTPGAKLDAGKPRLSLVLGGFAQALAEVTKVGTFGALKYTENGWREVPRGFERYTDAMLRHWLSEERGETHDPDSNLYHAAHLAWNAMARLELLLRTTKSPNKTGLV